MILRYLIREIPALIAFVLAIAFADIIALFIRRNGELPFLLKWAATADNLAVGDRAFWDNQMQSLYPDTWCGRYRLCRAWIRRNPAYWMDWYFAAEIEKDYQISVTGNTKANIGRDDQQRVFGTEGKYFVKVITGDTSYFEGCKVWFNGKQWRRIQFGWCDLAAVKSGDKRHLKLTFNRW